MYKIGDSAVRIGTTNILAKNMVVSDSIKSLWSTWTATLKDAIVLAHHPVFDGTMGYPTGKQPSFGVQRMGQFIYDGPSALYNVRWENFYFNVGSVGGITCHFLLNGGGGGGSSSKNIMASQEFVQPNKPIFCPKLDFNPKLWDWDGSLTVAMTSGVERGGFLMNAGTYQQANGQPLPNNPLGIDPLIDDGSCRGLDGAESIVWCASQNQCSLHHDEIENVRSGSTGSIYVDPVGSTSPVKRGRRATSRSPPFSDYLLYLRPNQLYRMVYDGPEQCFEVEVRDGQRPDVYWMTMERLLAKSNYPLTIVFHRWARYSNFGSTP
jgi:hypothetical protein